MMPSRRWYGSSLICCVVLRAAVIFVQASRDVKIHSPHATHTEGRPEAIIGDPGSRFLAEKLSLVESHGTSASENSGMALLYTVDGVGRRSESVVPLIVFLLWNSARNRSFSTAETTGAARLIDSKSTELRLPRLLKSKIETESHPKPPEEAITITNEIIQDGTSSGWGRGVSKRSSKDSAQAETVTPPTMFWKRRQRKPLVLHEQSTIGGALKDAATVLREIDAASFIEVAVDDDSVNFDSVDSTSERSFHSEMFVFRLVRNIVFLVVLALQIVFVPVVLAPAIASFVVIAMIALPIVFVVVVSEIAQWMSSYLLYIMIAFSVTVACLHCALSCCISQERRRRAQWMATSY